LDLKTTNADFKTYIYDINAVWMNQSEINAIERKRKIFQEYERVIAEEGPYARRIKKKEIYERVADNLSYSPDWVRKVITSFLKKKQ
jgi:hypothetical protein